MTYIILNFMIFCGIDEAGRGSLAGPVVVAAVIIPSTPRIEGINDSKKLTEKRRNFLFDIIVKNAIEHQIKIIDNQTIDRINILQATMRGMEESIRSIQSQNVKYLIDGNYFKLKDDYHQNIAHETYVKGDSKIYEISCASIIAKVTRDRIMEKYDRLYPDYGFRTNKGYGTKSHINAIRKNGLCPIHRKTFLKNIWTFERVS